MSTPAAKEREKRRQLIAIGIVAIIALLGINIYLYMSGQAKDQVIAKQETELSLADSLRAELQLQYDEAYEELEAKKGENEELNNIIEAQQEELKKLKSRIDRNIKRGETDKSALLAAEAQIGQLTQQLDGYIAEINRLKEDKELLTQKTVELAAKKDSLKTEVEKEKAFSASVEQEKQKVEEERENLASKVKRAEVLSVKGFSVKSLRVKKGEKEKETSSAKRTDRLKACFKVVRNDITPAGNNKFLLRIINPLGETIAMDAKGSGEFINQDEGGTSTRFTISESIDYDNGEPNVCIDWNLDTQIGKGEYTAMVYNRGYLVGETKFLLK